MGVQFSEARRLGTPGIPAHARSAYKLGRGLEGRSFSTFAAVLGLDLLNLSSPNPTSCTRHTITPRGRWIGTLIWYPHPLREIGSVLRDE